MCRTNRSAGVFVFLIVLVALLRYRKWFRRISLRLINVIACRVLFYICFDDTKTNSVCFRLFWLMCAIIRVGLASVKTPENDKQYMRLAVDARGKILENA